MAVSKNQPMRSAELDLIDVVNDAELENLPQLIKEVSTLEETVGDNDSGMVKDVMDLQTDVDVLENTVGDDSSGLVKNVADLITKLSYIECGEVAFSNIAANDYSDEVINLNTTFPYMPVIALTRLGTGTASYNLELTIATRYENTFTIRVFNKGTGAVSPKIGWIATTIGKQVSNT